MMLRPTNFLPTFVVVSLLVCDSSARVRGIHKRSFVTDVVDRVVHQTDFREDVRILKSGAPGSLKIPAESFNKETKPAKQDKKQTKGSKSSGEKKNPKKGPKDGNRSISGANPKTLYEETQGSVGATVEDQSETTTRTAKVNGGKVGKRNDNVDANEETAETLAEESEGVHSVVDTSETLFEADAADPELTKRSLTLLAIHYTTSSNQIPGSLDYIELARVTRHLLSNLFHWYYGNFQNIKYELLEMHRYTVLAPTLVKFDVTLHFDEGDGNFVPYQADIQAAIDEQLNEGSDYANLYINRLRNSAFGIFTATTSFRVITNGDDLQQLEEELSLKQGIDDFPNASGQSSWVNLVALLAFLVLSLILCIAVCTCCRRRRRRRLQRFGRKGSESSQNEFRDPKDPDRSDSSTGVSDYRTNVFSDQNASLTSLHIATQENENKLQHELEDGMNTFEDVPLEDDTSPQVEQQPLKEDNAQRIISQADTIESLTNRSVQSISTNHHTIESHTIPYGPTEAAVTSRNDNKALVSKPSWAVRGNLATSKSLENVTTQTTDSAMNVTNDVERTSLFQRNAWNVASKPEWMVRSSSSAASSATPVHSCGGTMVPSKPAWVKKSSTESGKSENSSSTKASVSSSSKKLEETPTKPTWVNKGANGSENIEAKSKVSSTTDDINHKGQKNISPPLDRGSTPSIVDPGESEASDSVNSATNSFSTKPIWASKNFLKPVNRHGSGQKRLWESGTDSPSSSNQLQHEGSETNNTGVAPIGEHQKKNTTAPATVAPLPTIVLPQVSATTPSFNVASKGKPNDQTQPSSTQIVSKQETKELDLSLESSTSVPLTAKQPINSSCVRLVPPMSPKDPQTSIENRTTEKPNKQESVSTTNGSESHDKFEKEGHEPTTVALASAPEWMMKFKQMGLEKTEE